MRALAFLCILAFRANASSIQDMADQDVIGKPISNQEMKASENLDEDEEGNNMDAILNSGHFEGDIVGSQDEKNRNAIINKNQYWPNAQVPYAMSADFSSSERMVIANAIRIYETKTCIRFKARTTETSYVHILKGAGCYSSVGRLNRRQVLSIGNGCAHVVIVLHEFMHAVGFYHEQSRTDRDQFVKINFENIQPGKEHNFKSYSTSVIYDLDAPYDYCSIMHYSAKAFSKNGKPTISVLKPSNNCVIGSTPFMKGTFSEVDILKLNTLYKCKGYPKIKSPDDIVGEYILSKGPFNTWHYVTITKKANGGGYTWTNRAGRSWTLTFKGMSSDGFNTYAVGTDSPYYTFANGVRYRTPKLFIRNGVTEMQGPFYELYKQISAGKDHQDVMQDVLNREEKEDEA